MVSFPGRKGVGWCFIALALCAQPQMRSSSFPEGTDISFWLLELEGGAILSATTVFLWEHPAEPRDPPPRPPHHHHFSGLPASCVGRAARKVCKEGLRSHIIICIFLKTDLTTSLSPAKNKMNDATSPAPHPSIKKNLQ